MTQTRHVSARTAELRAAGVSARQLRSRAFSRITHGLYLPGPITSEPLRLAELLKAMPAGTVVSHATAAALYGLPLVPGLLSNPGVTTVTVPSPLLVPHRAGLVAHGRLLGSAEARTHHGVAVTSVGRLFTDAAATVRLDWLVAIGDAALRLALIDLQGLAEAVTAAAGRRGVLRAREALPLLDGRAQSAPESVLRVRLGHAGIWLTPQCPVTDGGTVVAHADLGDATRKIAVEYEGRQHAEHEQFDRDLSRYNTFSALNWALLRAGRKDLRDGSHDFINRVYTALRSRNSP